jgi:hypothetical protein
MRQRTFLWILLAVLLVVTVGGLVWYAYTLGIGAGFEQGIAGSGSAPAPGGGTWGPFYPRWGYFHRPFGFGFPGFFFTLLFIFLFFWILRAIFWRGHWNNRWHPGSWEGRIPPGVEEWHRKMHEREQTKDE